MKKISPRFFMAWDTINDQWYSTHTNNNSPVYFKRSALERSIRQTVAPWARSSMIIHEYEMKEVD